MMKHPPKKVNPQFTVRDVPIEPSQRFLFVRLTDAEIVTIRADLQYGSPKKAMVDNLYGN